MAKLIFSITSPVRDAVVGRMVAVSGRVLVIRPDTPPRVVVHQILVAVDGGEPRAAQTGSSPRGWTCTVPAPLDASGGTRLRIVARAIGENVDEFGNPTGVSFEQEATVEVVLDAIAPDFVTIDPLPSPVTTAPGQPYVVDLSGAAGDAQSGIASVQLKVVRGNGPDQPFVEVDEVVPDGPGRWRWTRKAVELAAGVYRITARALDDIDNHRDTTAEIVVREPIAPRPVDQALAPTAYLLDLLDLARRYVNVGSTSGTLDPAMLAGRFHQPYDRLIEPVHFEEATRTVPQARIAVEVLRGRLGTPAPATLDQRFRGLAYQTFLRGLGTSAAELRAARTADGGPRAALAERIGLGPAPDGPGRLDELTVAPDTITDDELEALTGYRSTAAGDPLRPTAAGAKVLLWRRVALRARWLREDAAQRDTPAGPRPLIDPDVIGEGHLRGRGPADPAFALWQARRTWLTEKLAEIHGALRAGPQLARFDEAVSTFVGTLDLPGLAALDADGTDVRPDLPQGLDLDGFRFLARCRALLDRAEPRDIEPDDVASVLLQVQKSRQYQPWRTEERHASLVLEPASFTLDDPDAVQPAASARPRASRAEYAMWRNTLAARTTAAAVLETTYQRILEATEATLLPQLRDALVGELAQPQEGITGAAERLGRELLIDLQADASGQTTRVDQALETMRSALFATRSGRLVARAGDPAWTIDLQPVVENQADGGLRLTREFDREWAWLGSFAGWLAAARVFAYPENQLLPTLYVADRDGTPPRSSYLRFRERLRAENRLTPESAREIVNGYASELRAVDILRPDFPGLTDQLTDAEIVTLRRLSTRMHVPGIPHREIFWLVPMAVAAKLQESGQYQAALDWYRTVFAYHLPPADRRVYHGLTVEAQTSSTYAREPEWLLGDVNPHSFAPDRRNCYTKATTIAIAGCFTAFADDEFARGSADGNARARMLYETTIDLLDLLELAPDPDFPFPPNPLWESMREHARSGLTKIHQGLNIAGLAVPGSGYESTLPCQYRYGVLVDRAKNLVGIAQQVEAAYLSALEQRDAKAYDELRARHDLDIAGATVDIHTTRLAGAVGGVQMAQLQRQRAQLQEDHFSSLIDEGYSSWEQTALLAMGAAAAFHTASVAAFGGGAILNSVKSVLSFGLLGDPGDSFGQMLSAAASAAATAGQIAQTIASHERQVQDWQLQRDLAAKDGEIANRQVRAAEIELQLAGQERQLAVLRQDHAQAVATFLATRFTNTELFEWMSGVLGRVYAFFLQQATALARLAEAQLAFERQELPAGFVGANYWHDATADASSPDRRGLTGSARLLQDVHRLDQYAFDTDRRKLHLTQTFPLSQIAAFELQQFRGTGVLTFATPQALFDREFPGHYLRLIRRVKVSLVALLPPVRGIRATLSAAGVSRAVVARGPFDTVSLRRDPESIAFTSPANATGLFDLEPETGLLLPFEGMGVDTIWQLQLPKAANPFDYRSIADVLLTVEYTALDSAQYRERVVRELDRRFSGDRTFSVRNQFPDTWYELNNPESVEPDRRMRVVLSLTTEDLPPHIQDLRVAHVSLFVMRADALVDELTITSLSHTVGGQTVTAAELTTTGGIVSTRRPAGAAWNVHIQQDPTGTWELRLPDNELVRSWFRDELIDDLVLVLTLAGTTPEWR